MIQAVAFSAISAEVVENTNSHNVLFLLYFIANVIDLATGVMKAWKKREFQSTKLVDGILKKVGHWALVAMAVVIYYVLIEMGYTIGVNLEMTRALVWFVLSALIFQDARSVFENLMMIGVEIPAFLTKVLALAESKLGEDVLDGVMVVDSSDPDKDVYRLELEIPPEELATKDSITFKVKQADKQNLKKG